MVAQSVDYVEIYVSDLRSARDYFVVSMGFSHTADSQGPDRTSVLLRQGAAQLIITAGPATEPFLTRHGDGVADIALNCGDVASSGRAAEAAGAHVSTVDGRVVISGFGSVNHSLVPVRAGPGAHLPAHYAWTTRAAVPFRPTGRVQLVDHVAVCVAPATLPAVADFYRDALGLSRYSSEYVDVGDQAMDSIVVRSESGLVTFTLVAPDPTRNPGQLDTFLASNDGPGVQHLAFLVDDMLLAVDQFATRGVRFLVTPPTYYEVLTERFPELTPQVAALRAANVLADRDPWGYLLQLFSRSPYERNTLFYELIERRGSRGFGSANIRALYEAVGRDRMVAE